jgi:uncharacterized protein YbaR (Trm112 family)
VTLDERLLEVLVCPKCRGALRYDRETVRLVCANCKLAYPVRDGIPIMLEGEAERVDA